MVVVCLSEPLMWPVSSILDPLSEDPRFVRRRGETKGGTKGKHKGEPWGERGWEEQVKRTKKKKINKAHLPCEGNCGRRDEG